MRRIVPLAILIYFALLCAHPYAQEGTTTTTTVIQSPVNGSYTDKETSITTKTTTTTVHNLDAEIVSNIYAKYAQDSALIGTDLTVSSQQGIIILEGNVTMQSQADEAIKVAKSIPGVSDVRSNIVIKTNPKEPPKPNPAKY